jgi:hypothetical protein
MSTAILHAGSFIHDFNDIVMKVRIKNDAQKIDRAQKQWLATKDKNSKKHMFCFHNFFSSG